MINSAIDRGRPPESFKHSCITLICKDINRKTDIKAWRPISLLNTDYKIIAKAVANRIQDSLFEIVSSTQSANITGRSAQLNVVTLSDIIHWLKASRNQGCLITIDSEKAFDRVDHQYLFRCLEKANIDSRLINVIKILYQDCVAKVNINGHRTREFSVQRGVRQGCPLSASLFIISMEPFLQLIKRITPTMHLPAVGKVVTRIRVRR